MQWRRQVTWDTRSRHWRTAALFMVGSFCFAIGALPAYGARVDGRVVGVTFVVGSIFFTSAALSQVREVWAGGRTLDRWAVAVQLFGTVMFNFSTADALIESLDAAEIDRLVWAPDIFGSIAFLVASHCAWLAVCGRFWRALTDNDEWWVAALNYLGSVFFMASAIASLVLPTSGDVVNIVVVNAGTFLGAVCFFVGAYLLLPERGDHAVG